MADDPHFFLIGFRNRIVVFLHWIWTYFALSVGPRLITGSQKLPGWAKLIGEESKPEETWLDPNSSGAVEAPAVLKSSGSQY